MNKREGTESLRTMSYRTLEDISVVSLFSSSPALNFYFSLFTFQFFSFTLLIFFPKKQSKTDQEISNVPPIHGFNYKTIQPSCSDKVSSPGISTHSSKYPPIFPPIYVSTYPSTHPLSHSLTRWHTSSTYLLTKPSKCPQEEKNGALPRRHAKADR